MIRKLLIGTAAAVGLGALLLGTDVLSYVGTSASKVRAGVKNSIPLQFEIERARRMVENLVPDIRQNMHVIAEEEVTIEELDKEIAAAEKNLDQERERILALRKDLQSGKDAFRYAGRSYSSQQVKADLAHRFDRFKTVESTMKTKAQILEARKKSLEGSRAKLDGMLAAKRDLEVQVENLEAQLKVVQAAQTTSKYQFDDSQLSKAKQLVGEIRKRLDVAQRIVDQEGKFDDGIPIDESTPDDVVEQIDAYFHIERSPQPQVTEKSL